MVCVEDFLYAKKTRTKKAMPPRELTTPKMASRLNFPPSPEEGPPELGSEAERMKNPELTCATKARATSSDYPV